MTEIRRRSQPSGNVAESTQAGPLWNFTSCQPSPPVRCHRAWSADAFSPSNSITGRSLRATMNVPQNPIGPRFQQPRWSVRCPTGLLVDELQPELVPVKISERDTSSSTYEAGPELGETQLDEW